MPSLKKLLEYAKEHMEPNETIKASVKGTYETKIMGHDSVRSGVFIASDHRVLFYAKKLVGYEIESFPYGRVSSIEMSKGIMGSSITFFASGNKMRMKWIKDGDEKQFVEYVRGRIGHHQSVSGLSNPSEDAGGDAVKQIEGLARLRDSGVLTEEEFASKKAELLARL